MVRFAATQGSDTEAISTLADLANFLGQRTVTTKSGATTALTAAEMVQGYVKQTGTNGALSVATATAALIVATIPNCQVGSSFEFAIHNANDATITLTAGTGVTLDGTTAVPTSKSQVYRGVVTAVGTPAVTLYGILTAAI